MTGEGPRRFGRYEIEAELGRGATGVVYRAVDTALRRTVALKTTHLGTVLPKKDREGFERRFEAEARAAAAVEHPGVVVVHDVGRDPDTGDLFIAFEHLSGRTLADLVAGGKPLDWREALRLTARVAEALHHAHSRGVVHRDIKPANVMVLASGQPKILDFGVAKVRSPGVIHAGEVFGTPLYMSPEQARGEDVDGRGDLFSLGAVLYRLLTGRDAFAGANPAAVVAHIVYSDPSPPSRFATGLPQEVDRLAGRALAKAPADRYPDGETFAAEIERVLSGASEGAGGSTRPGPSEGVAVPAQEPPESAPPDPDSPLAQLLSDVEIPPEWGPPVPTSEYPQAQQREAIGSLAVRSQAFRPRPRSVALLATAAVVALVVVGIARSRSRSHADPSSGATAAPAGRTPLDAATAEPATETPPVTISSPLEGELIVSFEQPLERCVLRVWVGGALVFDETVSAPGKDVWMLTPLGDNEVVVEVRWGETQRTERLSGSFPKGSALRLAARIEAADHRLSLRWQ